MMNDYEIYEEIKSELKKKNKTIYKNKNLVYSIVLSFLLLPWIIFFLIKPHKYVDDLDNLPEPVQISTSGGTTMLGRYGETIHIDFLAKYDIQGRVLAKHDYPENTTLRYISPRDFVIGWGILGRKENMNKIHRMEYNERAVLSRPEKRYYNWFTETFGEWNGGNNQSFKTSFSNNHLIWSNRKIRLLLKKIKVGDVVRIKGYLVYIYLNDGWGWDYGPSSLVRDDHGCEIIYVTDVSRLKGK